MNYAKDSVPGSGSTDRRWLDLLSEEDLAFVRRFIVASGSLKEIARVYGVSYPTVRLRLDRLIAKIEVAEDAAVKDPFERRLRALYAEGRLDTQTFRELLTAHQERNAS